MSIKVTDLGLLILFILALVIGAYIIILIKNLNSSLNVVKKLF